MSYLKTGIISWVLTLTIPVGVLLGIYFFFASQFRRVDIEKVATDVGENRRDIVENSVGVERNAVNISENRGRIDDAEEAIGQNAQAIADNAQAIDATGRRLAGLQKEMNEKVAALEGEVKRLKESREDELAFRRDAIAKIAGLRKELLAISRRMLELSKQTNRRLEALETKAGGNQE